MKGVLLITTLGVLSLSGCSSVQLDNDFLRSPQKEIATHTASDLVGQRLTVIVPHGSDLLSGLEVNTLATKSRKTELVDKNEIIKDYSIDRTLYTNELVMTKGGFGYTEQVCEYYPAGRKILLTGQYIDEQTRCLLNDAKPFPPSHYRASITGSVDRAVSPKGDRYSFVMQDAVSVHDTGNNIWTGYYVSDAEKKVSKETLLNRFLRFSPTPTELVSDYPKVALIDALKRHAGTMTAQERDYVTNIDQFYGRYASLNHDIILPSKDGIVAIKVAVMNYKTGSMAKLYTDFYPYIESHNELETVIDYTKLQVVLNTFINDVQND